MSIELLLAEVLIALVAGAALVLAGVLAPRRPRR